VTYRLDIDGIRALAVLIVIGFHLDIQWLPGGHVGVDVFFVLSGFLITSVIYKQLESGIFSFSKFYLKRVQRLFPALFTVVLVTFIFAAFILFPDDFQRFAKSSLAAILSVSNVVFWNESGYWDVSSYSKPLLHTWSLGVEEQFYLLWPAILFISFKLILPRLKFLIILTFIAVLVCYWWSKNDISSAFYLLPARVFQFSSGAVLAVFIKDRLKQKSLFSHYGRNLIFITGLSLIAGSTAYFDEDIDYPGMYALVPTIGALLIILSGSSASGQGLLGRLFLENRIFIWVGRISYSLYLVHWPIIVFYRYSFGPELTVNEIFGLLCIMFILGSVLHYGVEKRFYQHRFSLTKNNIDVKSNPQVLGAITSLGLVIVLLSFHAWVYNGWEWRFKKILYTADAIKKGMDKRFDNYKNACLVNQWLIDSQCSDTSKPIVLFLGNSHEPDGFNFMNAAYPSSIKKASLFNFGSINDCTDLDRKGKKWESSSKNCQDRLDSLFLKGLDKKIDVIIYSAHHTFLPWNFKPLEFVRDIKNVNSDVKVVVIGDYVETKVPCVRISNESLNEKNCFAENNIAYHAREYKTQELYPIYKDLIDTYIDQLKLLCPTSNLSSCRQRTDRDVIFSYDNHHKSLEFSSMAGKEYSKSHPDFGEKLFLSR